MGQNSTIEWTNATWNPVVGCSIVSPGCHHCYAATMAKRLRAMALADIAAGRDPGRKRHYIDAVDDHGHWTGKLIPVPEALPDPLHWKKPRRIFVNSMSDLFHESVPFEFIDQVFAVMNASVFTLPIAQASEWHVYQILTKRAERMREYIQSRSTKLFPKSGSHPAGACLLWPVLNAWLGVSVENRKCLSRIDALRETPAAVRFLSIEPLLEDLGRIDLNGIHWVIVGGESGPGARPMRPQAVRSIRDQCQAAGVPFFFKQWGEWLPHEVDSVGELHPGIDCSKMSRLKFARDADSIQDAKGHAVSDVFHPGHIVWSLAGKQEAGRMLDGREWSEFPSAISAPRRETRASRRGAKLAEESEVLA